MQLTFALVCRNLTAGATTQTSRTTIFTTTTRTTLFAENKYYDPTKCAGASDGCTDCSLANADCAAGAFYDPSSCSDTNSGCATCSAARCGTNRYHDPSKCSGANDGCTACSLANSNCTVGEFYTPDNCNGASNGCTACSSVACQNQGNRSGTCAGTGGYHGYQCACAKDFNGPICEFSSSQQGCINGGKVSFSGDTCECPTGFSGERCQVDDVAEARAEAEVEAAIYLGSIGGATVLLGAVHYAFATPEQRSVDLYLLLTGGLLDATSDVIYVSFETFDNDELRSAAVIFLSLPVLLVSLSFWAVVATDYKGRTWRLFVAYLEGVLWTLVVVAACSFQWAKLAGAVVLGLTMAAGTAVYQAICGVMLPVSKFITTDVFGSQGYIIRLVEFAWWETTEKITKERLERNGPIEEVYRDFRFYERGLTQMLFAFVVVPTVILVGTIFAAAAFVITWCIGPALILTSGLLWLFGLIVAVLAGMFSALGAIITSTTLPLAFALMALLRLFVLVPPLWEGLFDLSDYVASSVDAVLPSKINFYDDDAQARLRYSVFGLTDKSDRNANDLLDTTVKYLAVEFCLESLPQIIIQVINNTRVGWSYVGIASMTVSVYAIISTVYKYGCKSRKKARRRGEVRAPARPGRVQRNPVFDGKPKGDKGPRRVHTEVAGLGMVERYADNEYYSSDEDVYEDEDRGGSNFLDF